MRLILKFLSTVTHLPNTENLNTARIFNSVTQTSNLGVINFQEVRCSYRLRETVQISWLKSLPTQVLLTQEVETAFPLTLQSTERTIRILYNYPVSFPHTLSLPLNPDTNSPS